jgi:hypothetical protein
MNRNLRLCWVSVVSVSCLTGTVSRNVAWGEDSFQAQERAAAAARAKDPAWKASCHEVGVIQVGDHLRPGALRNFCLNADGNILACFAPNGPEGSADANQGSGVRVYSPDGKLLKSLPLEIKPGAIGVAKDGAIFVAGDGQLLKLDPTGKVLAKAASPVAKEPVILGKEIEDMLQESGRPIREEMDRMKISLEARRF